MKKNKGIALINLTVTIIVILIITGMSIYYGTRENITTAYETDMYTEILNVSDAIKQRYLLNRANPNLYQYVGTPLSSTNNKIINNITYAEGWYYLSLENFQKLNLENVTNEYVANYETGEIVSLKPIVYKNKEYFSFSEINKAVGEIVTDISDDM